jgi:hypothetical protein
MKGVPLNTSKGRHDILRLSQVVTIPLSWSGKSPDNITAFS